MGCKILNRSYTEDQTKRIKEYSRSGLADVLAFASNDEYIKETLGSLTDALFEVGGGVFVMDKSLSPITIEENENVFGFMDPASKNIVLFSDNDISPNTLAERLIHELTHLLTVSAFEKKNNGSELLPFEEKYINNLTKIYEELRDISSRDGVDPDTIPALSNIEEFASEVFRSPTLQILSGSHSIKPDTTWTRFVNAVWQFIKDLIGFNSAYSNNKDRSKFLIEKALIANKEFMRDMELEEFDIDKALDSIAEDADIRKMSEKTKSGWKWWKSKNEDIRTKNISDIQTISDSIEYLYSASNVTLFADERNVRSMASFAAKALTENLSFALDRKDTSYNIIWTGNFSGEKYDIGSILNNQGYDYMKEPISKTEEKIKEVFLTNVATQEEAYEKRFSESFYKWLKETNGDKTQLSIYLKKEGGKDAKISQDVIESFLEQIDFNPDTDSFYKLSEINDDILKIDKGSFLGNDPIIRVRMSPITGKKMFSLIDVTSNSIRGGSPTMKGQSIFYALTGNSRRDFSMGTTLYGDVGGFRHLMMALQISHIIKNNPNSAIETAQVFTIRKDSVSVRSFDPILEIRNLDVLRKITPLYEKMNDSIKEAINYKDHLDVNNYLSYIDYISILISNYENYLNSRKGESELGTEYKIYKKIIKKYREFNSKELDITSLIKIFKLRKMQLERIKSANKGNIPIHILREDKVISELILDYEGANETFLQNGTSIDPKLLGMGSQDLQFFERFFTNPHNVADPVIQKAQIAMQRASYVSIQRYRAYEQEYEKALDELINNLNTDIIAKTKGSLINSKWQIFEPLFKTEEILDENNNKVTVNTGSIHYDLNDPKTKDAIAKGLLTEHHVKFGEKLTSMFQELIINYEFGQKMNNRLAVEDENSLAMKLVVEKVNSPSYGWKNGFVPIMYKESGEDLAQGNFSGALKKLVRYSSAAEDVFSDKRYLKELTDGENGIQNWFLTDVSISGNELPPGGIYGDIFGGKKRAFKMGIDYDQFGNAILLDRFKEKNENISMDLDKIFRSFALMTIRKEEFETSALPVVRAAVTHLSLRGQQGHVAKEQAASSVKAFEERGVHLRKKELEDNTLFGRVTNNAISILSPVASMTGVALSVPVGVISTVAGALNVGGFSYFSKSQKDLFGAREFTKAIKEYLTKDGVGKFWAIAKHYNVVENTERDQIESPYRNKMRKYLFQSHYFQFLNSIPDISWRAIVMAAQMIKDGTWEAHSYDNENGLMYDEKKDKRFYNPDGTFIKRPNYDGEALLKKIKSDVVNEGSYNQKQDEQLKWAYDFKRANKLKVIADKYIIGSMDAKSQAEIDAYTYTSIFAQFKRHLFDRFYNTFGRKTVSKYMGSDVYDPQSGEWKWASKEFEGYARTVFRIFQENKSKGIKMMAESLYSDNVAGLNEMEVLNIRKASYDLISFLIWSVAYSLIVREDDDKFGLIEENRLTYALKSAITDLVIPLHMGNLIYTLKNPAPIINIVSSTYNVLSSAASGKKPNNSDIRRITPFLATYETFEPLIEDN